MKNNGRHAKIMGDAASELVSFDPKGNRLTSLKGFATKGTIKGMLAGSLIVLSAVGDIAAVLDAADAIDEVTAATAPFKAKNSIKNLNYSRLKNEHNIDLKFIRMGDTEINMLLDVNSGNIFAIVTEDTDNLSAGQIVQIGTSYQVEDLPIFKNLGTGDTYANYDGWQVTGPSTGGYELWPKHNLEYKCKCLK